jgi:hypothetical protein
MANFANVVGKWGKQVILGVVGVGLAVCMTSGTTQAQSKFNVFGGYSYGTNNIEYGCECDPGLHGYAGSFTYNLAPHIGLEGAFTGHNGTNTIYNEPVSANNYQDTQTAKQGLYTYTFGPRFSLPEGNFSLFSHFLVGGTHLSETLTYICTPPTGSEDTCTGDTNNVYGSGFAFKTGAGVDWNHGGWGIRILEVDYIHSDLYAKATETQSSTTYTPTSFDISGNSFELATGVTFNFGGSR